MSQDTSDHSPTPQGPTDTTGPGERAPSAGAASPDPPAPKRPAPWWTKSGTTDTKATKNWLPLVRLGWAAAIALALLITWGNGPEQADWPDEVSWAQTRADLNNDSAEGAPQQQVVNGWHAADLAEIQINQTTELLEQHRHTANLLLVLGLGIFGDFALRAVGDRRQVRHDVRSQGGTLRLPS